MASYNTPMSKANTKTNASNSHAAATAEPFIEIYAAAPTVHLGRRLAAMVYELLIITAIFIVATVISSVFTAQLSDDDLLRGILVGLLVTGTLMFWFVWCWTKTGQTLPMKVWQLRVQHADGRKISTLTACLRLFCACFSLAVFGLGFLYSLIDSERRTLHDLICKTVMVRLPKDIRSV